MFFEERRDRTFYSGWNGSICSDFPKKGLGLTAVQVAFTLDVATFPYLFFRIA